MEATYVTKCIPEIITRSRKFKLCCVDAETHLEDETCVFRWLRVLLEPTIRDSKEAELIRLLIIRVVKVIVHHDVFNLQLKVNDTLGSLPICFDKI